MRAMRAMRISSLFIQRVTTLWNNGLCWIRWFSVLGSSRFELLCQTMSNSWGWAQLGWAQLSSAAQRRTNWWDPEGLSFYRHIDTYRAYGCFCHTLKRWDFANIASGCFSFLVGWCWLPPSREPCFLELPKVPIGRFRRLEEKAMYKMTQAFVFAQKQRLHQISGKDQDDQGSW